MSIYCNCQCHQVIVTNTGCNHGAEITSLKTIIESINHRLKEIENLFDIEKIKALIFEGAQTHLSILRCEARSKELEEKITRLFEEVRDIRELRYINHQQLGSLEARVNFLLEQSDERKKR